MTNHKMENRKGVENDGIFHLFLGMHMEIYYVNRMCQQDIRWVTVKDFIFGNG